MTEAEWVACTLADEDTGAMQKYLQGKGSPRKLRLFACACCRRIEGVLTDRRGRRALETAEKYADGLATARALATAWRGADRAAEKIDTALGEDEPDPPTYYAALAACYCAARDSGDFDVGYAAHAAYYALRARESPDEAEAQGRLLCDILGGPSSAGSLRWLPGTVTSVARVIYDERRFGETAIMADALEDAGSTDADLLAHLRSAGTHVRGCWALDLILGKS
jgi:hypothetical protein